MRSQSTPHQATLLPHRSQGALASLVTTMAAISTLGLGCSTTSNEADQGGTANPDAAPGGEFPTVTCPAGTANCDGICVGTLSDVTNCGGCGVMCGAGQLCAAGTCQCQGTLAECGGACVDSSSNALHCGACANACPPGTVCSGSACVDACAGGETQCGQDCVDPATSPFHCGQCEQLCAAGMICTAGSCTCAVAGQLECSGGCVDTSTDAANCGSCGTACAAAEACVGGQCQGATAPATGGTGGTSGAGGTSGEGTSGAAGSPPVGGSAGVGGAAPTELTYHVGDLEPTQATNGWGPIEVDSSNGEEGAGDGAAITIGGTLYARGLGVHAASDVQYALGGNCSTFLADVGIDDEVADLGTVVFEIRGDGQLLYQSGTLTGASSAEAVQVDVAGVQQLQLTVTDGGDGFEQDHADWADARLLCQQAPEDSGTGGTGGTGGSAGSSGSAGTGGSSGSGGASGSGGSSGSVTGTRDPLLWPFAQDSIWNMPIGSGAAFVPANLKQPMQAGMTTDEDIIVLTPSAPVTDVFYNGAGWSRADRCPAEGNLLFSAPMPANFVVSNGLPGTPNSGLAILMQDGHTVKQTQPFARCTAGDYATSQYVFADVDLYGEGITGCHGGSGLSCLGGALRVGELRPGGEAPRHVLKGNLYANMNLFRCTTREDCYRWPAVQPDGYAVGNYGQGRDGIPSAMKMGVLLALPPSVDIGGLGLETEPARMIAWSLQNYGFYVVDDTAWDVSALAVEVGPAGDFRDQFQTDWGFGFGTGVDSPFGRDMWRLFSNLHAVDNNGPNSIGGGGTPVQPLAPPLQ